MITVQNGDLSNSVSPRCLLVFEDALGFCKDRKKSAKCLKKANYEKALSHWELNEMMVRQILWLFHRKNVTIEVVTFLGHGFATEIRGALNDADIPVHRVWSTTVDELSRQIAYMPDLACVYDPEPWRFMSYGAKGKLLTSVHQLGDEVGYGQR